MRSKEYILDLGIGNGGEYLKRDDPEKTFRVGADKFVGALKVLGWEKHSALSCCAADAELVEAPGCLPSEEKASYLPFKDKVFDKVQILFPLSELLYGLCGEDKGLLWNDLKRILKDEGTMEVIMDVPRYFHTQDVTIGDSHVLVKNPEGKVFNSCKEVGFKPDFEEMSASEVKLLGTIFSEFVTTGGGFSGNDVYKITARKVLDQI